MMLRKMTLAAALLLAAGLFGAADAQTTTTPAPVTGPRAATSTTPGTSATTAPATTTSPSRRSATSSAKLDINTASAGDLSALPGMTPAYAQAVITGRPYRRKTDLVRKKLLPQAVYDGISAKIIAHRVKS